MAGRIDMTGEQGLAFFGSVSASLTHEMKNSLAILMENAGLLDDFAFMIEKGAPPDTERLRTVAARIQKQVGRADSIVGKMNRFAHSIDEATSRVDLNGIASFTISLAERPAFLKGVILKTKLSAEPVQIETAPFFLENLLWLCLARAMDGAEKGNVVELTVDREGEGARFTIACGTAWKPPDPDTFPSEGEKALLCVLGADLHLYPSSGGIELRLAGGGLS